MITASNVFHIASWGEGVQYTKGGRYTRGGGYNREQVEEAGVPKGEGVYQREGR